MPAAAQNVRYRQIRAGDRQGNGKQFQMSAPANPATEAYPALYDANGNVIARQPRGNTTVAQLADATGAFTNGHILAFDVSGNAKDGNVVAANIITTTMLDSTTITIVGGVVTVPGAGRT